MQKEFITKSGKKIIFRPLQLSDLDEALRYINKLSKEDTYICYSGEIITREDEEKWLKEIVKKIEQKKGIAIGAILNKTLIGTSDISSLGRREKDIGLFGISIDKEYRREGIGTALARHVLTLAKSYLNLRMVTLGVFANNPKAKYIYEKLGFKEYGTLPKSVSFKGKYVDHVYMYKNL